MFRQALEAQMGRVLVIGGTLFIGRALVNELLERDAEVVIMHRGQGTPWGSAVDEIQCDRNDIAAVQTELKNNKFDVIYDNVYDWQRGTMAEQVAVAAEAGASGLKRYVFTSSIAVYPTGGEYVEDAPLVRGDDGNLYAAQKAESERTLFELQRRKNIPVTTLRPAFVYGPHNPFDREAFFWDRIFAGRPIIIPEDGTRTMQWVHVRDVALAAVLAAEKDVAIGHAYNLGTYPAITQIEFVEMLGRIAGKKPQLVPVPRAQIQKAGGALMAPPFYFGVYLDIPPIIVRVERVQRELALQLTPLEEGLRETFQWYQQQQRPKADFAWEDRLLVSAR
jgi:nucleoside-diphosphate-sugar epimerase